MIGKHSMGLGIVLTGALLLAGTARAQTPPANAEVATTPAAQALTVDELIEKNLATKGGRDMWKAVQTQKMTGVLTGPGFTLDVVMYGKRPNFFRQETTARTTGKPPVTLVSLSDGVNTWTIDPVDGSGEPTVTEPLASDALVAPIDFDGALIDAVAKGYTVELLAPVAVAGKQAHHLRLTRKDVATQHYYLDPATFVELKITIEGAAPSDTELSDYRDVEGIMVPHAIRILRAGALQAELAVTSVEFNVSVADGLFRTR
mgnify:CR=1 FL=1